MSIKQKTFELCKYVRTLPEVEGIRKLFHDINFTNEKKKKGGEDYGSFGYLARQQKMQFLSYLILNSRYDELALKPELDLPRKLAEGDVQLFETAHFFISEVLSACLSTIEPSCIPLISSISPYFGYPYTFKNKFPNIDIENKHTQSLFDSFKKHRSISSFKECIQAVPQIRDIKSIDLAGTVEAFTQRIYKSGIFEAPKEIFQLELMTDKNSQQYKLSKSILALVSLKSSLINLTQLLFQAFLNDTLVSFDENNVFSYEGPNSNVIGNAISISLQPSGKEIFLHPFDLVFLNIPQHDSFISGLATIESTQMSFSQEYGDNFTYGVRIVDDDLSMFPNLS